MLSNAHADDAQQPPEGFDEIESVLDDYARKMRDGSSMRALVAV